MTQSNLPDSGIESQEVEAELVKMGHKVRKKNLGCKIQAIARYPDHSLHGVSDPRGEGASVGL